MSEPNKTESTNFDEFTVITELLSTSRAGTVPDNRKWGLPQPDVNAPQDLSQQESMLRRLLKWDQDTARQLLDLDPDVVKALLKQHASAPKDSLPRQGTPGYQGGDNPASAATAQEEMTNGQEGLNSTKGGSSKPTRRK